MKKVQRVYVAVLGDKTGLVSTAIATALSCKGFSGVTVHNDALKESHPVVQQKHLFPDIPGTIVVEAVIYEMLFAKIRLVSGSLVIVSENVTWPKFGT